MASPSKKDVLWIHPLHVEIQPRTGFNSHIIVVLVFRKGPLTRFLDLLVLLLLLQMTTNKNRFFFFKAPCTFCYLRHVQHSIQGCFDFRKTCWEKYMNNETIKTAAFVFHPEKMINHKKCSNENVVFGCILKNGHYRHNRIAANSKEEKKNICAHHWSDYYHFIGGKH